MFSLKRLQHMYLLENNNELPSIVDTETDKLLQSIKSENITTAVTQRS